MATPSTHFNYTDVSLIKDGEGFEGEVLNMGPLQIRVLEDGRNTDNRIGSMILTIKGGSKGPPIHWHRMHDETFFVTKGRLRFTVIPADAAKTGSKETKDIDTKAGDYVIVPPKSIHTFSNPFEEEAEFFNTFTPAYYVDYLRMLAKAIGEAQKGGKMLTEAEQRDVMAQFATFSPGDVGVEL